MATAHAKNRPPSAAKRWLPCPYSATVTQLYPNDETDASLKGDTWHKAMEDMIALGTLPLDCDPDMAEAMQELYDYVMRVFKAAGPGAQIYIEQRIDIVETGEFGTGDIIIVSPTMLAVIDHKSGYVAVDVFYNAQMMVYLLGLIAKYGKRPTYLIAVHQPNFDHKDGNIRKYYPTEDVVEAFRAEVLYSMARPEKIKAGHHCKDTYCPHRGACEAFRVYAQDDLSLGWHPSELRAMDDLKLAEALDAADQLSGYRNELRAEAMRRIMNMDRRIEGYKVVKGRRNRSVTDPSALILAVRDTLGMDWAKRLFPGMEWATAAIEQALMTTGFKVAEEICNLLGTPKHIEDLLKQYARQHKLPRNGWKQLYDNVVGEYIRETAGGLTLERAIDGRPAHKRGSEFGVIGPAQSQQTTITL